VTLDGEGKISGKVRGGDEPWTLLNGGRPFAEPTLFFAPAGSPVAKKHGPVLFIKTLAGELVCVKASEGKELWDAPCRGGKAAAVEFKGQLLAVTTETSKTHTFDTLTGKKVQPGEAKPPEDK
jgi:outer membrane protein assembly factor BamB